MEWKQFLILLNYTFILPSWENKDLIGHRILGAIGWSSLYQIKKILLVDSFLVDLNHFINQCNAMQWNVLWTFYLLLKALTQLWKAIATTQFVFTDHFISFWENIPRLSLFWLQPMSLVGSVLAAMECGNAERKQSSDPSEPESERLWLRWEFCWWAEARDSVTPTSASSRAGHTNPQTR